MSGLKRKYMGGAEKLRIKANNKKEIEKLKGSLDNYITKKLTTPETVINESIERSLNSNSETCCTPDLIVKNSDTSNTSCTSTQNNPVSIEQVVQIEDNIISGEKCKVDSNSFIKGCGNYEIDYSKLKKNVALWPLKISNEFQEFFVLCKVGFDDWRHVSRRLTGHERSINHRKSVCSLSNRAMKNSRIDQDIVLQHKKEVEYWRNVLKRTVAAIKFISQRGLPFFGDDEKLNSPHNGIFLGILELISEFDPFLANNLTTYGNKGSGNTNYISSYTVRKLIDLMANKVLNHILMEVKSAKYFGIIVDSTPDITHNDQMAYVLRYVNESGEVFERFIKLENIHGHTAEYLFSTIKAMFDKVGLDIKNCVGQSYDNAANMSGKYTGLQARIKELSPVATYVPCAAHSINLVGVNAVSSSTTTVNYFGVVQALYVFFSSSPRSQHHKHIKALRLGYNEVLVALEDIRQDLNQNPITQNEARQLLSKLKKKETGVLTTVWNSILQRINSVNKDLQSSKINVSAIVPLYTSLIDFIQSIRENFTTYEEEASSLNITSDYSLKRKVKKKSDIIKNTSNLLDHFPDDLDKETFVDEMLQFQELKMSLFSDDKTIDDPQYQLKYLKSMNIRHTFPNIETVLQIYLTIPCTNCSSERSFSALKRVKTRLRSCLSQDRLDNLTLLTVEHEITKQLSYDV
ncbi:zinc finger MYM-type protein 1-like [Aphis gossypii]|uniref:zinc finger MYM-type protein 1-like n=1 Tax=Aphis gossypii TaxID=80765 RepID=UPI0021598226|nr:zinc finger MYM-type protein 1-like [Aphis gossypii]